MGYDSTPRIDLDVANAIYGQINIDGSEQRHGGFAEMHDTLAASQ
jgi:hypothetical protein